MKNKNKNIKGFTLILSLVLLVAMSLMGGTLVVLSSSDHRDNNTDDLYQQAFYVGETGLLEAEKYLVNKYLGKPRRIKTGLNATREDDESSKNIAPRNNYPITEDNRTPCYRSFKNIIDLENVVAHYVDGSFFNIVEPIVNASYPSPLSSKEEKFRDGEIRFLERFTYEYFLVNIGPADSFERGNSVQQGSIDVVNAGTAFRIYSCGIYDEDKIIIPLESMVVLPD